MLLPAYLAVNVLLFESLLPVSGVAKQLKTNWVPSLDPTRFLRLAQVAPLYFASWLVCAPTVLTLARRGRLEDSTRRVVVAAALFPLLFFAVHVALSDWLFWDWYAYPILASLVATLPATLAWMQGVVRPRVMALVWSAVCLVPLVAFVLADGWRARYPFVEDARRLQAFLAEHEGSYAMGDRAGAVRLLSERRVVQTEGLVMDRDFLDAIEAKRDLIEVLRERDVRYYIVNRPTTFDPTIGGCAVFEEPSPMVRGPGSAAMRGKFCASPVLDLRTPSGRRIRIFDLTRETRRGRAPG